MTYRATSFEAIFFQGTHRIEVHLAAHRALRDREEPGGVGPSENPRFEVSHSRNSPSET